MRTIWMAVPMLLLAGGLQARELPRATSTSDLLAQAMQQASPQDDWRQSRIGAGEQVAAKAKPKSKSPSTSAPAAAPAPAASTMPGAYKPLTKDDNTPYRFNMEQNGKKMSAEEFDAWMKARGIRVAKGAPPKGDAAGKTDKSGK